MKPDKKIKADFLGFVLTEFAKNNKTGETGLLITEFKHDIKKINELDESYMKEPPYFYLDDKGDSLHLFYYDDFNQIEKETLHLNKWINFDDFAFYYRNIMYAYYKLSNLSNDYDRLWKTLFSCK